MALEYKKKMMFYILAVIFFIVLDRFFKFLAINNFFKNPINISGDFFKLNFTANYNIAFSLPISGVWLNFFIAAIIIGLLYHLIYLARRKKIEQAVCLTFVIFGAISNLADRFRFGFVIDYFDLEYFTVFNIADMMIVGGVVGLIIIWTPVPAIIKKRPG